MRMIDQVEGSGPNLEYPERSAGARCRTGKFRFHLRRGSFFGTLGGEPGGDGFQDSPLELAKLWSKNLCLPPVTF